MPGDELAGAVQELLDERAIRAVLVRYSRGVDRCDEALIRSVYHADASDDHGDFKGSGFDFAARVIPILRENFETTMHDLGNVAIELDGDTARVETTVVAYHVTARGDPRRLVTVGARYLDRFERRGGEWKISRRVVVVDWSKTEKIEGSFPAANFQRGARGRDDPSYGDF